MVGVGGAVGIGAVPIKAKQRQGKKVGSWNWVSGSKGTRYKGQGTGTGTFFRRLSHGDQRRSQNEYRTDKI